MGNGIKLFLGLGLVLTLGQTTVLADQSQLKLTSDTPLTNQELSLGPVRVVANYQPATVAANPQADNLQLQIFHADQSALTVSEQVFDFGQVDLIDLDRDGEPEVIVQAYTGGAHCCMAITTYTWQNDHFQAILFDYLDSQGGQFKDLNRDGQVEFVTVDNAFFYAFSSFAGSFPPTVVLNFQHGTYIDTTAEYSHILGSTAWNMYQALSQAETNHNEVNGVLAGYVAQKIRIGQYQEGWDFMLTHYDTDNDWGLDIYNQQGDVVGTYPNFPAALKAFLTDLGYLDVNGRPQATVSRSPVVQKRVQ